MFTGNYESDRSALKAGDSGPCRGVDDFNLRLVVVGALSCCDSSSVNAWLRKQYIRTKGLVDFILELKDKGLRASIGKPVSVCLRRGPERSTLVFISVSLKICYLVCLWSELFFISNILMNFAFWNLVD